MKTLPGLLLATALALAATTDASAYHFSPRDVSAHLHGTLTFTPNEGGNPFICRITFDLKTKIPLIKAVKFIKGDCVGVTFQGLPWLVDITGPNSGLIGGGGFSSSSGNCVQGDSSFQDNKSGIWTLPAGQCISGRLTSNPPTTIVK